MFRNVIGEVSKTIEQHWFGIVLICGVIGELAGNLFAHITGYRIWKDSFFFLHAGWYMNEGAVLYCDIWDITPPLIFYLSSILSFIADGIPAVQHALATVAAAGAVILTAVMISKLVYLKTKNGFVSIIGGMSLYVMPDMYMYPIRVFHPEYFSILFLASGLYYLEKEYFLFAGLLLAISSGFYQHAIILTGIGALRSYQKSKFDFGYYALGGMIVAIFTLLPLLITGSLSAAINATIFDALMKTSNSGSSFLSIFDKILNLRGPIIILFLTGIAGWVVGVKNNIQDLWWLFIAGVLHLLLLFFDFSSTLDLPLLLVFLAIGTALLFRTIEIEKLGVLLIAILIFTSVIWATNPMGIVSEVKSTPVESESPPEATSQIIVEDNPSLQEIFWSRLRPENRGYYYSSEWSRQVCQTSK
jgi:hypothetical protein